MTFLGKLIGDVVNLSGATLLKQRESFSIASTPERTIKHPVVFSTYDTNGDGKADVEVSLNKPSIRFDGTPIPEHSYISRYDPTGRFQDSFEVAADQRISSVFSATYAGGQATYVSERDNNRDGRIDEKVTMVKDRNRTWHVFLSTRIETDTDGDGTLETVRELGPGDTFY